MHNSSPLTGLYFFGTLFTQTVMTSGISSYAYTWAIGVPGHEPEHPMSALDLINKVVLL